VTGFFSLVQQQEHKEERWICTGGFSLPQTISRPKIVDIQSLESFDVFVFLLIDEYNLVILLFYDLLGQLVFNTSMGKMANPTCLEIDQHRREILIGVESGRILCYFVNTIRSSNNVAADVEQGDQTTSPTKTFQSSKPPRIISPKKRRPGFQITLRTKAWVPMSIGKYAMQIDSVDLLEYLLVLTDDGGIMGLNTSLFDPIFTISSEKFLLKPCRIWADKFGSDFLVHCKNADTSSEILEYWR
jgi:hypothetical protein